MARIDRSVGPGKGAAEELKTGSLPNDMLRMGQISRNQRRISNLPVNKAFCKPSLTYEKATTIRGVRYGRSLPAQMSRPQRQTPLSDQSHRAVFDFGEKSLQFTRKNIFGQIGNRVYPRLSAEPRRAQ